MSAALFNIYLPYD